MRLLRAHQLRVSAPPPPGPGLYDRAGRVRRSGKPDPAAQAEPGPAHTAPVFPLPARAVAARAWIQRRPYGHGATAARRGARVSPHAHHAAAVRPSLWPGCSRRAGRTCAAAPSGYPRMGPHDHSPAAAGYAAGADFEPSAAPAFRAAPAAGRPRPAAAQPSCRRLDGAGVHSAGPCARPAAGGQGPQQASPAAAGCACSLSQLFAGVGQSHILVVRNVPQPNRPKTRVVVTHLGRGVFSAPRPRPPVVVTYAPPRRSARLPRGIIPRSRSIIGLLSRLFRPGR